MNENDQQEARETAMRADTAAVVDLIQQARVKALGAQAEAGRTPRGRVWSVAITELEKINAWLRTYA